MLQKIPVDASVTLCYKSIGEFNSNLPLLLFLHEGLGSIAQWKNFPQNLCNKLRLPGLIYERYGYGHSTPLQEEREDHYLEKEAEYYLPLLIEKLNLRNRLIILIGHSDGATIALLYAAVFPKNIVYVVSMAAHVFWEQISADSAAKLEVKYKHHTEFREKFRKYHLSHSDNTLFSFTKTITRKSFQKWNVEHYLDKIESPILILQGKNDHYGTEKQVQSILKNTKHDLNRFLFIDDCGHSPHLEKESTVIEQIVKLHEDVHKTLPLNR